MAAVPANLDAVAALAVDHDATYADDGGDPTVKLHQQEHDALALALQAVRTAFPGLVAAVDPVTINTQAGAYSLVIGDAGNVVRITAGTAVTVSVPLNASVAFPVGTVIEIEQAGAGQVTVGGSVTLLSAGGVKTRVQYSALSLLKVSADTWRVSGDTTT